MLICEVLEFCLGGQLFAALPVVIEGIAGPCKNMCFSSFEKLQLFQQILKKIGKHLNCFGIMGFISTWKRSAVHNL